MVLLGVALACLVFQLRMPGKAIAEADYQAVAQVLETEGRPGDVVLLYPWWTERARLFLPERIPIVGYSGSDTDALELHPRIWVLAEPNLPRSDLDGFLKGFSTGRTAAGPQRKFGGLTLQPFDNHRHRPLVTNFASLLPAAQVWIEGPDGSRSDCPWDGKGHRCANGSEVIEEWHEILFAPHRCVRFYPPGGAARLVAEFSGVPAAPGVALRAGMTWDRGWFHMPELTPTDVGVDLNGQPAAVVTIQVGQQGVQAADGPPIPEGATVRIWSRAQSANLRELCVELYGLEKAR